MLEGRAGFTPLYTTSLWIRRKQERKLVFIEHFFCHVKSSDYFISFHLHYKPMGVGFISPILQVRKSRLSNIKYLV